MTRRQALISAAMLVPFGLPKDGQLTPFGLGGEAVFSLHYNWTEGTLTIRSKTRSVTVSIEEIMDALEPPKAER